MNPAKDLLKKKKKSQNATGKLLHPLKKSQYFSEELKVFCLFSSARLKLQLITPSHLSQTGFTGPKLVSDSEQKQLVFFSLETIKPASEWNC